MNGRLLFASFAVLAVAFAAPSGEAKTYPVSVKVPRQATLENFMNRKYKETVTCTQASKVTTSVFIRSGVARRLGFKNVTGKLVLIATNRTSLKARTPTRLAFVLTPQAKSRLGKATATVSIFGSVRSVPNSRPTANYSVGWTSKLT